MSDGQNKESAVTEPAVEAEEERQGELSFGPRI
jgi:hypothetical protein